MTRNYLSYLQLLEDQRSHRMNEALQSERNQIDWQNTKVNMINADTNRLNYGVNATNAATNQFNAYSNREIGLMNAQANLSNAATNARNADTSYQRYLMDRAYNANMVNLSKGELDLKEKQYDLQKFNSILTAQQTDYRNKTERMSTIGTIYHQRNQDLISFGSLANDYLNTGVRAWSAGWTSVSDIINLVGGIE